LYNQRFERTGKKNNGDIVVFLAATRSKIPATGKMQENIGNGWSREGVFRSKYCFPPETGPHFLALALAHNSLEITINEISFLFFE
jgi:hypothetical protein